MHQSTAPSMSPTIWPRWASWHFLTLPIVQTLLPVTFGYSLRSEAAFMRQLRSWKRLWRRSWTRSQKRTSMGPSRSCRNGTTSISAGVDYFKGDKSSMCVKSINEPLQKKNLETYLMILVYIYIYIYLHVKYLSSQRKICRNEISSISKFSWLEKIDRIGFGKQSFIECSLDDSLSNEIKYFITSVIVATLHRWQKKSDKNISQWNYSRLF